MIPILIRIAAIIFGWLFVGVGIIGLALPILQGFIFLVIGFYLLNRFSPGFKRLILRIRGKHHRLDALLDRLDAGIFTKKPPKSDGADTPRYTDSQ